MTFTFKARLLAAVSLGVSAAATGALAQEAQPFELDEIVVTVQKREQSALDVPLALTVHSGEFLERIGVQDFAALSQFTPGLLVQDQSFNNPGFVMRGITSDSGDAYVEPRVSVFQDGVSISKSRGSYVELFDIARVEVAKGPQSTLFGRGALIGGVNIIQNRADPSGPEGRFTAAAGNLDYRLVEGMANLPLGDTAAIRFAGRWRARDGHVENLLGGENYNSLDTWAGRIAFNWRPTERLNANLFVNYQEDSPSGTAFKARAFSPTDPVTGAVLDGREPWQGATLAAAANFPEGVLGLDRTVWGVTAQLDYSLNDAFSLSSITAYREFDALEVFDPDGVSLPLMSAAEHALGEQWSQEFRINYDVGGRVRWFAGAGYFREEASTRVPLQFDERIALAQLTGMLNGGPALGLPADHPAPSALFANTAFTGPLVQGLVAALSGGNVLLPGAQAQAIAANLRADHLESSTNAGELTSWDLFADVSFDVTDRLELGAGLRFTTDQKTTSQHSSILRGERSVLGGIVGAAGLAADGSPVGVGTASAILGALAAPNAGLIPPSALYPIPQFGLFYQPTTGNGQTFSQDLDDQGFTWRLTARYALSEDASVYANYGRGRRPEVLSVSAPAAPDGTSRFTVVAAEEVDSFEIGAKTRLRDLGLRLEGALFYYQYENFQTQFVVNNQPVTVNAGEAESYGFEGQAFWAPAYDIDLFVTYGWNHSRFGAGLYEGNRFRLSPDHALSVGGSFRFQGLGGEFDLRPTYVWRSKIFFDNDNDIPALQNHLVPDLVQDEYQDSYGLLNLRLSYAPLSAPWTVELFAENVLDKDYIKDAGNTGDNIGLPTFIAGTPRTWGAQVSVRF